jgi:sigma-70-like protein
MSLDKPHAEGRPVDPTSRDDLVLVVGKAVIKAVLDSPQYAEMNAWLQELSRQFLQAAELLEAIAALQRGEKGQLRRWMEEHYGVTPDRVLRTMLREAIPKIAGDTDAGAVIALARRWMYGCKKRLTEKVESSDERKAEVKRLNRGLKRLGELRRAFAEYPDPADQMNEIHRALFEVENELAPGEPLTRGKIEHRIKTNNGFSGESVERPRKNELNPMGDGSPLAFGQRLWHTAAPRDEKSISADQIARLDDPDLPELAKFFEDPTSLAPYFAVEEKLLSEWLITAARQRLTQREFEVFEMTLDNQRQSEIATRLGITPGRVSQLLKQVQQKLADIA